MPNFFSDPDSPSKRLGVIAALGAFGAWGVLPIYFKWVEHVGALEIITHRVLWSIPVLALFLAVRDGRSWIPNLKISARTLAWLALSAVLLSANWLIFVWAVINDQVLSTSLGYLLNPLANVLLGFIFLQERLTRSQKIAVGIAALGTLYLGLSLGVTPWVSIALPLLFGFYGLVRKRMDVGPMKGLMWENLLLLTPALAYLLWRNAQGQMDFLQHDAETDYLLLLAGLLTVLPLIWFNTATRFLTLTVVGFFQYMTPTMTMLLAVFLWGEPFTRGHQVAFACIWTGIGLISLEQLRSLHRRRRHG